MILVYKKMIAVLAAMPVASMAQTSKFADPAVAAVTAGSGASSMAQVSFALLLVLALVFAAAWAMRKFRFFNQRGQAAIEVLQGVNLGAKERAVLIRVQGRRLLLGVASGQVSMLAELADEETDETVAVNNSADAPSFKALLKRSMGLS